MDLENYNPEKRRWAGVALDLVRQAEGTPGKVCLVLPRGDTASSDRCHLLNSPASTNPFAP